MKEKSVIKVLLWSAVLIWAAVIYMFSAQPAQQSKAVSSKITEKIIVSTTHVNEKEIKQYGTRDERWAFSQMRNTLTTVVRKSAHFFLYLVLGIITFMLAGRYNKNIKKIWMIALLCCLAYAISDEIHQYFVPGRACMWQDVLIDFCGSFIGSGITILLLKLKRTKTAE
ncbi:MAG: VanZ family protein [Bacillota bacterium]|nr:VanZ family protein [Bacillota bacterium]